MSELQGGKFGHGFASAGLSVFVKPLIHDIIGVKVNSQDRALRVAVRDALNNSMFGWLEIDLYPNVDLPPI